jgi:uncharacterized protein YbjQ (UPF0145 family)
MDLIVALITTGVLLVLGFTVGGFNERRHFKQLQLEEQALSHIRVNNLKTVTDLQTIAACAMVSGQVVIGTDYFKSMATSLRGLLGGEMKSAQTLMTRARREALVRLLHQAQTMGAAEVWNVRFASSNIGQSTGKKGSRAMQAELFAWGTAIVRDNGVQVTPPPGQATSTPSSRTPPPVPVVLPPIPGA